MASKPFNFYQGGAYGTGFYYPYTALDFFTGVYFPASLAAGQTVGFLWEGMGQKIVEQTVSFSGQAQDSNKETASLRLGFYGYSTPLVTESGRLLLRLSGNVPSDTVDRMTFSFVARGSGIRDTIDSGILKLNLTSGIQLQDNHDINTMTGPIRSGVISQDTSEIARYTVRMWGNFFAKSTPDDASVNMQISSISYSTTAFRTVVSSGTGVAISFRMTDIFYDTAV
jgi:hypothetical protein